MMKKPTISLLLLIACSCSQRSGNMWEDNQTGAKYSRQNASALWGSKNTSSPETSLDLADEEFLPLSDEDLKSQFSDKAIPQGTASLGEGGVPEESAFLNPSNSLAAIFQPVFFKTDQYSIQMKEHIDAVAQMARYLKSHPNASILIEGHCDKRGPEAYNMALGSRRANSVRNMLINLGVDPNQIHTISFGKEKPFVLGDSADALAQNRRAHIRIHNR